MVVDYGVREIMDRRGRGSTRGRMEDGEEKRTRKADLSHDINGNKRSVGARTT
jgi:hypothetical protein